MLRDFNALLRKKFLRRVERKKRTGSDRCAIIDDNDIYLAIAS